MLTYVARPRGLYKEPINEQLTFPSRVELAFKFEPGGLFGGEGKPSRTVPLGSTAKIEFNACRAETRVVSNMEIQPLSLEIQGIDSVIIFQKNVMKIALEVESRVALDRIIETYYYGLPPLLSIDMIEVPQVSEVHGIIGKTTFCWGILDTGMRSFDVTTPHIQEQQIATALKRLGLFDEPNGKQNRRLLAATQYFYIACRLSRSGDKLGDFLAESLLNYAKILEVLFPAPPGETLDGTRSGLRKLGFNDIEIEGLFIPALALRNAIDVAHPILAIFPQDDAYILHRYADEAEDAFRELIQRVFNKVEDGLFSLQSVQSITPSAETSRIVRRIRENLENAKR